MSDQLAGFEGRVPRFYDEGLGPVLFTDFADQIAGRVAAYTPMHVLETAAGTGIVTRRLRDLLPAAAHLTASDLNSPMLDVARTKFRPGELVEFKPADAIALPFPAGAFDAVVCQFGFMFFPDKVIASLTKSPKDSCLLERLRSTRQRSASTRLTRSRKP